MNPEQFIPEDIFPESFPLMDKMIQRIEREVTSASDIKCYYNVGNFPAELLDKLILLTENTLSGRDIDLNDCPIYLIVWALIEVLRYLKIRLIDSQIFPTVSTQLEIFIEAYIIELADHHKNLLLKLIKHYKTMNEIARSDEEAKAMVRNRILGELLPIIDYYDNNLNDKAEIDALDQFIHIFDRLNPDIL